MKSKSPQKASLFINVKCTERTIGGTENTGLGTDSKVGKSV